MVGSRDHLRQLGRIVSAPLSTMVRSSSESALPDHPSLPANDRLQSSKIPLSKRVADIGCVLLALPALIPLMLAIAIYIKIVSPGPVFYHQQRVGYRERRFQLLKFRSMHLNADSSVHEDHTTRLYRNNLPLTKIDAEDTRLILCGGLLRSSGLDELPQVLNVIRGEMSLVGPRPCTNYEYALFDRSNKARFNVLPGITGLWQVSGKNTTTFQQMIELDSTYARDCSFSLDLKIIVRTLPVLCRQVRELIRKRWPVWRSGHR
jgi:lipopolysaccharide/colanic/teichoic acid biosynthesis glycosyltransferase